MNVRHLLTKTVGTAMLAGALMLAPQAAQAHVFISVGFAPPALPVYEQPLCPGDGYIWTPGYWAYTDDGYEWVDGTWVLAPYTGALWTPGYWGFNEGAYLWNAGYWGPTVGYYGDINYGFGYFGVGFYGGYWNHGSFFYNREYNHFGGGFRGNHFYSQHYGNFDGRPGGTSFASGHFDGNRSGSFNNATNRSGFGQNGFQNGGRSTMQSANAYRNSYDNGNSANGVNRGNTNSATANGGFGQNGFKSTSRSTMQSANFYRGIGYTNRGTTNTGGFSQNQGRSTMMSAAPYASNFNRGSAQPASNSFRSNSGFTQQAPSRPASSFQGNFQSNGGRPSGSNNFHAPSAASGGFHPSSGGGGASRGGRR